MPETPRPPAKWADLGVRTLSAAVLIPAALLSVWAGGIWFNLLVALIAVLIAHEWTAMAHGAISAQFALHAAAALCGALLPLDAGMWGAAIAVCLLWAASALLASRQPGATSAWNYLGVPYAGFPAMALVLLRADPQYGALAILWILAIVWAADTFAYFAGRTIGGPKLAPLISPKKTWAGLGGAVAGSAAASALFAAIAGLPAIAALAVLAGGLAVIGQAGDLFKSALKRHYGVKDSGNLIPGHGGVIDRVDGLVAVAVAAAMIGVMRGGMESTGRGLLLW
ncbi:MAG: phosphatidate cytidylyltransferase [Hyphomicrobiales bacterium]